MTIDEKTEVAGVQQHRCMICSKTFKRHWHLTRHEQSHSSDRPFKCPLCVRVFARQDTLSRHLTSHAKARRRTSSTQSSDAIKNPLSAYTCALNQDLNPDSDHNSRQLMKDKEFTDPRSLNFLTQSSRMQPSPQMLHHSPVESSPDPGPGFHGRMEWTVSDSPPRLSDGDTTAIRLPTSQLTAVDLPDELYTGTVDLQARQWLRDLCAGEDRVTEIKS